jgi:hypothetical protein
MGIAFALPRRDVRITAADGIVERNGTVENTW